ncbi:MAG: TrmJ/YjtD family RNA methyltransferase [bacterium]|nr:TrmJ/YjtD family RNA methyltransferase [bacterium]
MRSNLKRDGGLNMADDRIRIVLVRPSDARNIGAVARAMRVTGFTRLVLVASEPFDVDLAAQVSCRSEAILADAVHADSVREAVADCDFVVATTRRARELGRGEPLTPRTLADDLAGPSGGGRVAILFGAERIGLTNDELAPCHRILTIPSASPEVSLNLAQAVMVVCYELSQRAAPVQPATTGDDDPLATTGELEEMYAHLARAIEALEFPAEKAAKWQGRLRGLLQRARLRRLETYLFRTLAERILRRADD